MITDPQVYIGWDPHEMQAWNIAERSAKGKCSVTLDVHRLALIQLRHDGLYRRSTQVVNGHLWDEISEAPMSTEHAISRFFIPMLHGYKGWALFMDGDVLVRGDLAQLFALADPAYAIQVVQHPDGWQGGHVKKDDHVQTSYPRKNWSSVVLWNCEHPAHRFLTVNALNTLKGRDLHRFCWLADHEIGTLPAGWNHLVGVTTPEPDPVDLAHFTLGLPNDPTDPSPYAQEWFAVARRCGYSMKEVCGARG